MGTSNRGGVVVVALAALAVLVLVRCTFGMEYVVGDGYCKTASWAPNVSCDYNSWALHNNFLVGDSLVFNFDPSESNVAEMSKKDYDGCIKSGKTPKNAIESHMISPATITLSKTGTSYLVSTVNSGCSYTTLQLAVTVNDTPSDSPIESPNPFDGTPDFSPPADDTPDSSPPAPTSSNDTPDSSSPRTSSKGTSDSSPPAPSSGHHGSVVGPVVGTTVSVVIVVKISLITYCIIRRRRQNRLSAPTNNVNNNHVVVNVHEHRIHQGIPLKNFHAGA